MICYNNDNVYNTSVRRSTCHRYSEFKDIEVGANDCRVKADIKLNCCKQVRIYGQVTTHCNEAVANALVRLFKVKFVCGKPCYKLMGETRTNCNGNYEFEVEQENKDTNYRVAVYHSNCSNNNNTCNNCHTCQCN